MMALSSITLMPNAVSALLSVSGAELADSRRYLDLLDVEAARVQYKSTAGILVRVDYSADGGETWAVLVDETGLTGDSNPYLSTWQVVPAEARVNDVLLRAYGVGTGLLVTVSFVELQFR